MKEGTLQIQSENILPIIKQWLYTDKEIFLRELVSNSCDAITKLKILHVQGKGEDKRKDPLIEIDVDPKERTIKVRDNGIGMTSEEVEKYIARLAFSGAEDFVKKYQDKKGSDQTIGHFGLGFYSAFMPSDKVEIDTLSFLPESKPAFWSCDGSSTYSLDEGKRKERGTTVTLHISKEDEEFLDEGKLRSILLKHCRFLPFPILLNGKKINDQKALWVVPPSQIKNDEYLSFYRSLYPLEAEPMFWVHLNVDYPFHLQGILYFPKLNRRFEAQSHSVHLYCNRVFVSENCKDILPDYLTILRGILDSPDIPLNVSRSNLQMSRTMRQLSNHISKKITDKLVSLYQTDRDTFIKYWPDIELIIKLGILQDDKFYERIRPCIIWKSSNGSFTTLEEYLDRNREARGNKVFYYHEGMHTSHFFDMYKKEGIEILHTSSHLDVPLISFLEKKDAQVKFCRLDGAIDEGILDKQREKTILDDQGKTQAGKMADFIRSHLTEEKVEVEAKSLKSDEVSAFLMLEEEGRRLRDYLALSGKEGLPDLAGKKTFVINTNNPLIQSIYNLRKKDLPLAKELISHLYDLSLLEQKELPGEAFGFFLKRSNHLLEKLSKYADHPITPK